MKKRFIKNIIFSKTPLTTYFMFADHFQIYPCEFENAPKSKLVKDTPLIIEYWVDEDENPAVGEEWIEIKDFISTNSNQMNKLNRITRLLSAVTNHRFFIYSDIEIMWGMEIPEVITEEINTQSSKCFLGQYYYPSIAKDLAISGFSEQKHANTIFQSHQEYYTNDPFDNHEKEISFPNTINAILSNYFLLDPKSRKVVDTVAHLICNGLDLQYKMKSISFLTFVSAIETLVNYEFKDQKDGIEFECHDCQTIKVSPINCQKCGRPIWGVKAKFKTFLKHYVAGSEDSIKKYNRIYNFRSEIVHNGLLLLGDEQTNWTKSEKADSQWMTHIETMQLARISLVNWLLMGHIK